ncbi:MAG: glycosyltransferase family A protein [Casimicrobiaceae bacterium]
MSREPRTGVVIPYFQRESGILARALRSVAHQTGVTSVRVIVVDDASPVPAAGEIATLEADFPFELEIIVQPNAGPGAARNRGIAALANDARYIAFLDSDDEWSGDHLARATFALSQGFDAYFADLLQLGAEVTAFRRAGRINPREHPAIAGRPGLRAYSGDMFDQVLTGNVIGTPTVVYDRQRFPDVRFRPEYQNAGEDYLFWIDLARAGARFAFSETCEVTCGAGVNVFASAGWGTQTHFLRLHNEMKYRKAILDQFPLSEAQRNHLRAIVVDLRQAMARDLLHRVAHRKPPPMSWVRAHARLDPLTYASAPWHAVRLIAHAIVHRAYPDS